MSINNTIGYQTLLGDSIIDASTIVVDQLTVNNLNAIDANVKNLLVDDELIVEGITNLHNMSADDVNVDTITIASVLNYPVGAGDGKVLTSDATGIASWQPPADATLDGDITGLISNNLQKKKYIGNWDSSITYDVGNQVSWNDRLFKANTQNTNEDPSTSSMWDLVLRGISQANTDLLDNATDADTANTLVKRDSNGDVSVGDLDCAGITMATGAQDTYVLTSNGVGEGTWQPPTGGSTINGLTKYTVLCSDVAGDNSVGGIRVPAWTKTYNYQGGNLLITVTVSVAENVHAAPPGNLFGLVLDATTVIGTCKKYYDTVSQNQVIGNIVAALDSTTLSIGSHSFAVYIPAGVTAFSNRTYCTMWVQESRAGVVGSDLTGDVTSVGTVTTLTNSAVIGQDLTGYVSGAGTITASDSILSAIQKLNGNASGGATLAGDVTGAIGSNTVALVGGSSASNVHSAELLANAATSSNTANAIVKRDSNGDVAVHDVSMNKLKNSSGTTVFDATQASNGVLYIGQNAGNSTTVSSNIVVGNDSGTNMGNNWNIIIGSYAATNLSTGQGNIGVGTAVFTYGGSNASYNVAVGDFALRSITTIGSVGIGAGSLGYSTSGVNTAVGHASGQAITTGTQNVLVGYRAGEGDIGSALTIGNQNTLIGHESNVDVPSYYNSVALGYRAMVPHSNAIQLGNSSITNVYTSGVISAPSLAISGAIDCGSLYVNHYQYGVPTFYQAKLTSSTGVYLYNLPSHSVMPFQDADVISDGFATPTGTGFTVIKTGIYRVTIEVKLTCAENVYVVFIVDGNNEGVCLVETSLKTITSSFLIPLTTGNYCTLAAASSVTNGIIATFDAGTSPLLYSFCGYNVQLLN